MSAVLKTPFTNWEMTKMSYKHAGSAEKFECNAAVECSRGQHTADLKVSCSVKKKKKKKDQNSPTVICSVEIRPKLTDGSLQRTEQTKTYQRFVQKRLKLTKGYLQRTQINSNINNDNKTQVLAANKQFTNTHTHTCVLCSV